MSDIATKLVKVAERQQALYDKGIADGTQAEYDAFWDAYQNSGTRSDYSYAFAGRGWTPATFKPKYTMRPKNAAYMFCLAVLPISFREWLDKLGVSLDFSNCTNFTNLFQNSTGITELGEINVTCATAVSGMFSSCSKLKKIERIVFSANSAVTGMFTGATLILEELYAEGTIGKTGFSVSTCPRLNHDSLMSIINCLADYSGSTSTYKVTFGSTNLAKLTAEELAIIGEKGWTYA